MNRTMIDTTHDGFPTAIGPIKALPAGNIVAMYDTGSGGIAGTSEDWSQVPANLHRVTIDQGFTGSPNMSANVRDCENGAWILGNAVNRTGWNSPRPTLYLGSPDTVQGAADAGWKGDVWLVEPSDTPPAEAPPVPAGLHVVAVQWNFKDSAFDESVVFDPYWPAVEPVPPHFPMNQTEWRWCVKCQGLFYGPGIAHSKCPAGGAHTDSGSGNYQLLILSER